ncbi:MAG: TRAFAC clade GTPase domain-containing protein [Aminivibrio sp.]|jgi:hypothetical protein
MANKKYKIAILGAPGAGKTVFLGSYFNLVLNLGQGKPVTFKTPGPSEEVDRVIDTLFKQQTPVEKKVDTELVEYSVDSLGMDLSLFQIPGEHFDGKYAWEASPVLAELERADGAIFILPADLLTDSPKKALEENRTFIKALSFLFESKASGWGGEDTPVVFLFTKGDTVPEVETEELLDKMTALFMQELDEESPLGEYLQNNRRHVQAYKVIAVGDWPDSGTLPKEYEPQNAIKPMEELYKIMHRINKKKKETRSILIAIGALLILAVIASWGLDMRSWSRTKDEVAGLVSALKFDEALKKIDGYEEGYIFPDPLPLIPSALRGGADKDRIRDEIARAHEQEEFKSLGSLLENLDTDRMPDVKSGEYLETAGRVEKYLGNLEFQKTNRENYEKVKSLAWYFEAGQALLGKTAAALGGEAGDIEEAYSFIERWLEYLPNLPEQWVRDGAGKAGELFSSWAGMLKPDSTIEETEAFIALSEKIASNPAADDELKKLAAEKIASWKKLVAEKWMAQAREWISEAETLSPEKSTDRLAAHLEKENLPEEAKKSLAEALEAQYTRLAETIVSDESIGIDGIKEALARFGQMPEGSKKTLQDRIFALAKAEVAGIVEEIDKTESLQALVGRMNDLKLSWEDYPEGAGEIAQRFEKRLSDLISVEWKKIDEDAALLTEKKDFTGAKDLYTTSLETVSERIEKAGLGEMSEAALSEAKKLLGEKLEALKAGHFAACKEAFDGLKSIKDGGEIAPVREKLSHFASLWASSEEAAEAKSGAAYLEAVESGAKGTLTLVGGDFKDEDSFWGSPDIRVSVLEAGTEVLQTKTAKGQAKPSFGEKLEFDWDVASSLTFIAIDEGGMFSSDREVLKVSVDGSGIFGHERFSGTIKDGDNSLTIKFEADLPESPWK